MSTNHIFGTDNLIDDATLSILTGTANTQYPLSNLKIPITSKVFRSTGATVEILVDTGASNPVNGFMLVGDNVVGLGLDTVSIYGSTTTGFGGADEIEIDLNEDNNFGFKVLTEVTFRYWKIVLDSTVYCELSNIYLGKTTSITTNAIALGSFKYSKVQNANITTNNYGNKFITTYNTQKKLQGSIKLLNETEYNTLRDIRDDYKKTTPMFFITDPDNYLGTNSKFIYSGYFYFTSDALFTNTHPGLWSSSLSLLEVS